MRDRKRCPGQRLHVIVVAAVYRQWAAQWACSLERSSWLKVRAPRKFVWIICWLRWTWRQRKMFFSSEAEALTESVGDLKGATLDRLRTALLAARSEGAR